MPLVCDDLGLIGKEMSAIDGCKMPSNASKEWSGTREDFEKKADKLEKAIAHIITTHREQDRRQTDKDIVSREERQTESLNSRHPDLMQACATGFTRVWPSCIDRFTKNQQKTYIIRSIS